MGLSRALLGIAVLGACGGSSTPSWTVVAQNQPSALLSVWAGSEMDAWVVGGNTADAGPFVAHYDGSSWTKMDTGQRNVDLWWVKGFDDGNVFMSGSNGTILRFNWSTNKFEKLTTPGNAIVFGMWGAASNDVWAVGGGASGASGGFVWRFDGTNWTPAAGLPSDIATSGTCWKVNGQSASDIWISGTNGLTLHWNGSALQRMDIPEAAADQVSLFSVGVNSKRAIAVGGAFSGVLFENDGSGWKSALPSGGPLLSGVAVSEDDAYAVGQGGTILHRSSSGKWSTDKPVTGENLHAAFIDSAGDTWAVGGEFDSQPTKNGVLLHKGAALQGSFP